MVAIERHGELPEDAYPALWWQPYGQAQAREIVSGGMLLADQLRAASQVLAAAALQRGCPSATESPSHRRMVEQTVERLLRLTRTGRLERRQLEQLLAAWDGKSNLRAWHNGGILQNQPELLGSAAYLLATRMLRVFGRTGEAQELFRLAMQTAKPGSDLWRLAKEEFDRLNANG